jgi:aryl-alcohol dehydrogenase-like predicted oxidoreductase
MTLRPEPYAHVDESVYRGLGGLRAAAEERGVETAVLAIAWLLAELQVSAVIVGPRRPRAPRAGTRGA